MMTMKKGVGPRWAKSVTSFLTLCDLASGNFLSKGDATLTDSRMVEKRIDVDD